MGKVLLSLNYRLWMPFLESILGLVLAEGSVHGFLCALPFIHRAMGLIIPFVVIKTCPTVDL